MQAASNRRNRGAAAEAEGKQQLKWMPQSGPGAAAEADASGEQQLKRTQSGSSSAVCTESCPAPDNPITHGRGSSFARSATCYINPGYDSSTQESWKQCALISVIPPQGSQGLTTI